MARSIDPLVVGKVIGDVIDTFVPSVDMAIHYSSRQVTNGCQMKPSATAQAPEIQLSDNSEGNNYYTLTKVGLIMPLNLDYDGSGCSKPQRTKFA
uniref:Mother of FT and TFL1-like protein variant b n=1 Tax=Physcomitrium patens TaxID=3218 RepID=C0L3G7_PHYPA|nr:mother of FT and TFL1-like protein variant b [Physcomitrium patens]